ncbi:MAG TPA: hypothetical protein VKT33_07955 [Candidatus Angelobacter sp.]|nr:hypothetical protein [Candidatus Angelobacter sp.]
MQHKIPRVLSTILAASLCVTPEMIMAQQNTPVSPAQQPTPATPGNTSPQPGSAPAQQAPGQQTQQNRGTTIDPAQAPLQPVTTYPDASGTEQNTATPNDTAPQRQTTLQDNPQPKRTPEEPLGAATAGRVNTVGGAASKPAGLAIAPAKQHQTRSLLIKIGAIAAAGAAIGTVYALSRGTPSSSK